MKKFLLVIMLCILFPITAQAECSTDEKIALSKMVSNIKITPVFNEEIEKFNILISNITPSVYLKDMKTKVEYVNTGGEVIIYNVNPNQSYRIRFYSAIPACYGDTITTIYVTLPGYNKYYKDPLCEGLEDYKICQKWVNYNYNRTQFETEIKKIDKEEKIEKKEEHREEENVKGFYDYLGELYEKYYYIFLPIIIIGGIILMNYLRKKEDFF